MYLYLVIEKDSMIIILNEIFVIHKLITSSELDLEEINLESLLKEF